MKRIFAVTLILCCLLCQSFALQTPPQGTFTIKTIVIDAGHGGHDSGCLGSYAKEKNVTLAVALKLGELIKKNYPHIKIIYTRDTDEFIELHERAEIANRNNADLFISIHCNANSNKSAYGTESWVMGLHKTDANLEVAKRENSSILLEDNYAQKYDGFNPNSPESYIMFSLNQNAHLGQSLNLAAKVEEEFGNDGRSSRGVKQAGYLVLWRTTMPSLLIETGFLTNKTEEKYLASEAGQVEVAQSIFNAVVDYKKIVEGKSEAGVTEDTQKTLQKINQPQIEKVDTIIIIDGRKEAGEQKDPLNEPPVEKATEVKTNPAPNPTPIATATNKTIYKVQIAASDKPFTKTDPRYKGLGDVSTDKTPKGVYRYMVGNYTALTDAQNRLKVLKGKGFKDAFVVAYKEGERVPVK